MHTGKYARGEAKSCESGLDETAGCSIIRAMIAAVLHGREDVRIENVPERALAAGEIRVEIGAALTCGTDLKVYKRGYHAKMITPPAVFGHEMAGVVSETGVGVAKWKTGDRVVVANSAPCSRPPSRRSAINKSGDP